MKGLITKYYEDSSLVKQQLDSFNMFIEKQLQEIINDVGVIKTNVTGFEIKLGKARIEPPRYYEARGGYKKITPAEARIRNITYSSPLFLEMVPVFNGVERPVYSDIYIGEIPIMVKSKLCHLHGKSKEELIKFMEDPSDPGGYFIINGTERALISIEDLVPNKLLVTHEKDKIVAKIFSTRKGFRARCVVNRNADGVYTVEFPSAPGSLPFVALLRILGLNEDQILEEAGNSKLIKNDMLLNLEIDATNNDEEAVDYISKRLSPGQPKDFRLSRMDSLIDNYLLPHIGSTKEDRKEKAKFLIYLAKRATLVYYNIIPPDDKDHYANKRVKLAGSLMQELFRYAFQFLVRDIIYQASRANARGRHLNIHTLIRQDALSDRIRYAMATGNWIANQTGVSQLLDRTSYIATVSHLRRIVSPLSKRHPHFEARDLHGTHLGRLCPSETPEGPNCSLVKNLASMAEVSTGTDEREVIEVLNNLGIDTPGVMYEDDE